MAKFAAGAAIGGVVLGHGIGAANTAMHAGATGEFARTLAQEGNHYYTPDQVDQAVDAANRQRGHTRSKRSPLATIHYYATVNREQETRERQEVDPTSRPRRSPVQSRLLSTLVTQRNFTHDELMKLTRSHGLQSMPDLSFLQSVMPSRRGKRSPGSLGFMPTFLGEKLRVSFPIFPFSKEGILENS